MAEQKPLIDEDGEVRELTLEDFKRFRPVAEVLSPALLAKIRLHQSKAGAAAHGKKRGPKVARLPTLAKE
jgi:hypothetical protein